MKRLIGFAAVIVSGINVLYVGGGAVTPVQSESSSTKPVEQGEFAWAPSLKRHLELQLKQVGIQRDNVLLSLQSLKGRIPQLETVLRLQLLELRDRQSQLQSMLDSVRTQQGHKPLIRTIDPMRNWRPPQGSVEHVFDGVVYWVVPLKNGSSVTFQAPPHPLRGFNNVTPGFDPYRPSNGTSAGDQMLNLIRRPQGGAVVVPEQLELPKAKP